MAKEFKEKTITINLRRAYLKPTTKRAKAALFVIRAAVQKESRAEQIAISNGVNEKIWERGLHKIPRKITVKIVAEKEGAMVYLPDEKTAKKEEKKTEKKGEAKVIREKEPEKIQEKLKEVIEEKKEEKKNIEEKNKKAEAKKESKSEKSQKKAAKK